MNEEILKRLKQTLPEDFDGHTAFARMTPDQRLTWLEEANAAYLELHNVVRFCSQGPAPNGPFVR